ncbi:MAG: dihydrofolate reductase [Clostridia bacterium]|nr:dihydrofolate reductase [Clostridia bacterium]
MILSIIVAAAENGVIGRDNGLVWHLSSDLKHFKALTTGHTILMGRRTFESVGRALPYRRNVVITRDATYVAEGCEVVHSVEEALRLTSGEEEVFVTGGGMIYKELWGRADRVYLTVVHTTVAGDTVIPPVLPEDWEEVSRADFPADEKNEYAYSFINYERKR